MMKLLKEFTRWRQKRKENAEQLIPFADHDIRGTHCNIYFDKDGDTSNRYDQARQ
jgi:hypothetical protein